MLECFNTLLSYLKVMDMQLGRKCTTKYGNSFLEHISKSDMCHTPNSLTEANTVMIFIILESGESGEGNANGVIISFNN